LCSIASIEKPEKRDDVAWEHRDERVKAVQGNLGALFLLFKCPTHSVEALKTT